MTHEMPLRKWELPSTMIALNAARGRRRKRTQARAESHITIAGSDPEPRVIFCYQDTLRHVSPAQPVPSLSGELVETKLDRPNKRKNSFAEFFPILRCLI